MDHQFIKLADLPPDPMDTEALLHYKDIGFNVCLLTEDEKVRMCGIVSRSDAEFIKTSTGFSTAGATFDDVALFAKYVGPDVKIKAAGGIASFDDAAHFAELGASRLGTSRLVKILKASLAE